MEFNFETIKGLSVRDVITLDMLVPMAKRAEEIEKLIKETYVFHIGEKKIEVWHDEYNHEDLTYDGVWQAIYLHQQYYVNCTADKIFELMKAEFLITSGFCEEYGDDNCYTEYGELAAIYRYFKNFVTMTEEKAVLQKLA